MENPGLKNWPKLNLIFIGGIGCFPLFYAVISDLTTLLKTPTYSYDNINANKIFILKSYVKMSDSSLHFNML